MGLGRKAGVSQEFKFPNGLHFLGDHTSRPSLANAMRFIYVELVRGSNCYSGIRISWIISPRPYHAYFFGAGYVGGMRWNTMELALGLLHGVPSPLGLLHGVPSHAQYTSAVCF